MSKPVTIGAWQLGHTMTSASTHRLCGPHRTLFAVAFLALASAVNAHAQSAPVVVAAACPALLQQTMNRLQDEKPQVLCQYVGKVLLVVNTASYCGYT